MRIIVDGNDGVGKTTVAKTLKEVFNITSYIHLSYKDPSDFNFYNRILEKDNVIFDRSFLDELIYADVLGRKSNITPKQTQELAVKAKELGFLFIICHTSNKNYSNDEHEEIIKNEDKIDSYFKNVVNNFNLKYFDPFNDSIIDLVKWVETQNNAKL